MIFKNNVGWYAGAGSVRHDFYINGPIEEPSDYDEMLQILNTASETDAIYLHINTPGGNFAAACQICDAIMQSKAGAIIACAEGEVCSAGTMIFLACSGWHVSPFATFMFHTSSGYHGGKMPDGLKQAKAHEEHLNRVAGLLYTPFFDDDEVHDIINNNQDVWLTPEEVTVRLQAMAERFEAELKEAEAAMQAEAQAALDEQIAERVAAGVEAALAALEADDDLEEVEVEPEEVEYTDTVQSVDVRDEDEDESNEKSQYNRFVK